MYCDLNVSSGSDASAQRECMCQLLTLGYGLAATTSNSAVPGRLSEADRCSTQCVSSEAIAAAGRQHESLVHLMQWDGLARTACSGLAHSAAGQEQQQNICHHPAIRQLTRLTFPAGDPVQAEALAASAHITATYDLLAIQPTTERVLQQACSSLDVDIISLDMSSRLPFKLKPAVLRPALIRGIMFEVCYAPALEESAARVMFISNVQALARCTRGRNIILSSGAASASQLRSPHAAASLLACILDQPVSKAADALTHNAWAAVAHGAARKAAWLLGPSLAPAAAAGRGGGKKVQGRVGHRRGYALPSVPVTLGQVVNSAANAQGGGEVTEMEVDQQQPQHSQQAEAGQKGAGRTPAKHGTGTGQKRARGLH